MIGSRDILICQTWKNKEREGSYNEDGGKKGRHICSVRCGKIRLYCEVMLRTGGYYKSGLTGERKAKYGLRNGRCLPRSRAVIDPFQPPSMRLHPFTDLEICFDLPETVLDDNVICRGVC